MTALAPTYLDALRARYGARIGADGHLNDYLSIRDGHLYLRDLDLYAAVRTHGSPLELVYTPLITERVQAMIGHFERARAELGYRGEFIYANASKANVAEEVVRHALLAGAHHETSSTYDVDIARLLWRRGVLRPDRLVLNNGFKVPSYAENIMRLRREGYSRVLPVFDDPTEVTAFASLELPTMVGLRQRIEAGVTSGAALDRVESRFGMDFSTLGAQAVRLEGLPNLEFKLYHAMLGSQLDDQASFIASLLFAVDCYCTLKLAHPSLEYFDFGGGVPVGYSLDFDFDYASFARELLRGVQQVCAARGAPEPTIVGEFGRYTTADHGAHLFRVVATKPARDGARWYIVDSSLMVSLPDSWGIGQKFIVLPLHGFDRPARQVWLGGLTCDSDDIYKEAGVPGYLSLPDAGSELYLGFFGTGAYQEMLSGVRGAHHCLLPEAKELIVELVDGVTRQRVVLGQTSAGVLEVLGYGDSRPVVDAVTP